MIVPLTLLLFSAHDWLIVPGERVGPVKSNTTDSEITALFGPNNVRREKVHVGEGFFEEATLVYPDDPSRRLAIVRSPQPNGNQTAIYVCFEARNPPCRWKTAEGVSLGTTLKQLEAINRRPFLIAGFGWDWEGTIVGYPGGRLAERYEGRGRLILRLRPKPDNPSSRVARQVLGDKFFSSGHPAMQALNPAVYQVVLEFPK